MMRRSQPREDPGEESFWQTEQQNQGPEEG